MASPALRRLTGLLRPCSRCMSVRALQNKDKGGFRESGYLLLVLPAAAFGLGCWQVKRRYWKLALISDLEERTLADPVALPDDLDDLKELEYRKVLLRGEFDHSKEIYMVPRSLIEEQPNKGFMSGTMADTGKTGVHVVTPFKLSDRDLTILVNRGWVSRERNDPKKRAEGQPEGVVDLIGVVRMNEKRQQFAPKNLDTKKGQWYHRDIYGMAATLETDPIFVDADRSCTVKGGPIGGQTRVTLRNEHLSYIFTWYTLAALMFYMWYKHYWKPPPASTIATYMNKKR
ncbi:unnamed protein product [Owenia fusiformis]|uniref:SURF1-like protein n=1 Tax=Owenia fusiformis TaxID=6347 RepID=A0A8J1Y2U8_OWEFU|nr:unnamed protein product [Owenia fusiformis]